MISVGKGGAGGPGGKWSRTSTFFSSRGHCLDGISAGHLIHSKEQLVQTICLLLPWLNVLIHQAMIKCVLLPVVKNKTRSITDKSNYRPIAISTVLS